MGQGLDKLIKAVTGDVPSGAVHVGQKIKGWVVGSGDVTKGAIGGVVKTGINVLDGSAGIAGNVIGAAGKVAEKAPGLAAIALIAVLFKPVTNLVKNILGIKDSTEVMADQTIILNEENKRLAATLQRGGVEFDNPLATKPEGYYETKYASQRELTGAGRNYQ